MPPSTTLVEAIPAGEERSWVDLGLGDDGRAPTVVVAFQGVCDRLHSGPHLGNVLWRRYHDHHRFYAPIPPFGAGCDVDRVAGGPQPVSREPGRGFIRKIKEVVHLVRLPEV